MNAIVFNFMNSDSLIASSEALALRSAYILCEVVTTAGTSNSAFFYEDAMKKASLEMKVTIIENRWSEAFQRIGASGNEVLNLIKLHKKIKHPQPQQIITFKKIEKIINDIWKEEISTATKRLKDIGLLSLKELFEKNEMGVLNVDVQDAELEREDCMPASKILSLDLGDDAQESMFFLPFEFAVDLIQDKLLPDQKPLYLEKAFVFPNINLLSVEELRLVKNDINADAKPFQTKVKEWITSCATSPPDTSRKFFYDEVMPLTHNIKNKLEQNSILTHISSLYTEKLYVDVLIGEVPMLAIWSYYTMLNIIPQSTIDVLGKLSDEKAFMEKRVPVLINKVGPHTDILAGKFGKNYGQTETPPLPSRKTLDID